MDETSARLVCHQLFLSNPALVKALCHFNSARAMLSAKQAELRLFFHEQDLIKIKKWQAQAVPEQLPVLRAIEALRVQILAVADEAYPKLLCEIPDPPALLYVIGDIAKLRLPQIAIVGSRKMTPIGGQIAQEFACQLGRAGITITSGLALGIDSCAHQGALTAGANTIAVLGTGIDGRYPRTNTRLYDDILASGGVLVSEYPWGTPPRPGNFPKRNRIITGLSMATLVVEASERSGSLVSARLAAEQGREVFAVPGNTRSLASSGCHQLIREGATLVTEPSQILEGIGPMFNLVAGAQQDSLLAENQDDCEKHGRQNNNRNNGNRQNPAEHWLIEALGTDCLSIDELCDRCRKSVHEVTSAITECEIAGTLVASPFGYQRVR